MPKIQLNYVNDLLNEHIDAKVQEDRGEQRGYMGLSQVGTMYTCPRKAWYTMHGYNGKPFPGRILRLFRTGEDIEFNVVTDLINAGFPVTDAQKAVIATQDEYSFTGHIDGIVHGLDQIDIGKKKCLFECKSANEKSFAKLQKLQSYEAWNETYKAQVHVYAFLLGLDRILVCVENKNTSQRYWERIHVDQEYAIKTLVLAFEIYRNPRPERVCPNPAYYQAKFCDHCEQCFNDEA